MVVVTVCCEDGVLQNPSVGSVVGKSLRLIRVVVLSLLVVVVVVVVEKLVLPTVETVTLTARLSANGFTGEAGWWWWW